MSRCPNLISLVLDHNYLVQGIPQELGMLSKLTRLYLRNNNLTGTFPASIGNLTSLQELYLSYNNLEGEIPGTISQMKILSMLGLSKNSFSGEFPPALYNITSLKLISLSFNNFFGSLESGIGLALPNLQRLYLADNFLSGSIPVSLSNASGLLQFDIPNNNFTGHVPTNYGNLNSLWWFNVLHNNLGSGAPYDLTFVASLTNCSSLQLLDFASNQFEGKFPKSIANLSTQLTHLLFDGNQIGGNIPEEITNLVNLTFLSVGQNFLEGNIPTSIGKLSNLKELVLESNQLTGELPVSIGNISRLLYLYVEDNRLQGSIPSSLGNLKYLQSLDLSLNSFTGIHPGELMELPSLTEVLNVSSNLLTGPLPSEVGNWSNLVALDFSYNRFSDTIPSTLGKCLALEQLYIQGNSLEGSIPDLSQLKNIQFLDLSSNNLSGQIPMYMSHLPSVQNLNLSLNNLEGEVPLQGVFRNASAVEVYGNIRLCGGVPQLYLQSCSMHEPAKSRKHHTLKVLVISILLSLGIVLLLLFLILRFYLRRRLKHDSFSASSSSSLHFYPKISYEELVKATGAFSSSNLLGTGSFGDVYRGTLHPDGISVAIKVLKLQQQGALKSFIAECQALKNTRHRNLVKVLTVCSSTDHQGNDFKALVYQLMPNGNLEVCLHSREQKLEGRSLNILQRMNIAIDVASALHYLHHQCQTPVVHCDIKPSNVLLDEDMTAYVSDFGLARFLRLFNRDANLDQFSTLGIKGTLGYAAPEYGMGYRVSTLGDVYSYGILLLEIFTGRRPTDELFKNDLDLHNYVKKALPDKVMDIVDHSALCGGPGKDASFESLNEMRSHEIQCITSIMKIGVACSAESPKDRVNMRHVVCELISIRHKYLGTEVNEVSIDCLTLNG